jgi:hypothetical protein
MLSVLVFGEDYGHEVVLRTLLDRLSVEHGTPVEVLVRSATGGHGRMMRELRDFINELGHGRTRLPDVFIVARDANCLGYAGRVQEITAVVAGYQGLMIPAVPDPHIERWLLIDP